MQHTKQKPEDYNPLSSHFFGFCWYAKLKCSETKRTCLKGQLWNCKTSKDNSVSNNPNMCWNISVSSTMDLFFKPIVFLFCFFEPTFQSKSLIKKVIIIWLLWMWVTLVFYLKRMHLLPQMLLDIITLGLRCFLIHPDRFSVNYHFWKYCPCSL